MTPSDEKKTPREFWKELGDEFGWKLDGYSGKREADFVTNLSDKYHMLTVTQLERDQILSRIDELKNANKLPHL